MLIAKKSLYTGRNHSIPRDFYDKYVSRIEWVLYVFRGTLTNQWFQYLKIEQKVAVQVNPVYASFLHWAISARSMEGLQNALSTLYNIYPPVSQDPSNHPPPPTTTHSDTHNVPGDLLLWGLFDIGNCVTLALLAGSFDNDNKQYPDHPHPTPQWLPNINYM